MVDSMAEQIPEGMEDFVPGAASTGALTSALEFLSGDHTARVFVDGPENVRVQIKDALAERNLVSNGDDAWLYDSQTNVATHMTIPADAQATAEAKLTELSTRIPTDLSTPAQVADRFLTEIDPSTTVSVGTDSEVAGRAAYELVLTPKSTDTLVASVSIAVDSATGLPLQVTVLATGQEDPAFTIGFSALTLETPSADLFDFTPPAGAAVEEQAVPTLAELEKEAGMSFDGTSLDGTTDATLADKPVVTGTGWDSVVEISAASVPSELLDNPLVSQLATEVEGGRLLSTSLLNVFLADDGRVFAGSVSVESLQAAASAE
jgi:outer membrane lipoprotein-sorting protein